MGGSFTEQGRPSWTQFCQGFTAGVWRPGRPLLVLQSQREAIVWVVLVLVLLLVVVVVPG